MKSGCLACSAFELNLSKILPCGQSFRWKQNNGKWMGVLHNKVWALSQDENYIFYQVYFKGHGLTKSPNASKALNIEEAIKKEKCFSIQKICDENDIKSIIKSDENFSEDEEFLKDYFQLSVSLSELYKQWGKSDPNFKRIGEQFTGIRQLRQDPIENVFSFICSSNNNISRITGMVESMCKFYGEKIAIVDGIDYYAFPTVENLAGVGVEEKLRELGFGYRARYIAQTAKFIQEKNDPQWLYKLRKLPYLECRNELLKLCGIGPKVADCICLMSMDKFDVVPIDTHVFQFAIRDYNQYSEVKKFKGSFSPKMHFELGNFFRSLWGEYAGWAQSVLFSAELSSSEAPKSKKLKEKKEVSAKRKSAVTEKIKIKPISTSNKRKKIDKT